MKSFSLWARRHRSLTRFILTFGGLLHLSIGVFFGILLYARGVNLPGWLILPVAILTALFVNHFPKNWKQERRKKMICHTGIYSCAVLLSLFSGNVLADRARATTAQPQAANWIAPGAMRPLESTKEIPVLKKWTAPIRKAVLSIDQYSRTIARGWAFLLFLVLAAAAGFLAFVFAALACDAGCSGNEVLGGILLVGAFLMALACLFCLVYAFVRLFRKEKLQAPTKIE